MAGGTFKTMNKARPGAYINFESVPKPLSSIGSRGIVTFPVSATWGAENEIIELYSTDLLDGKSLQKIGLTAADDESLVYRLALSNAYMAYVYRIDAGATKATATLKNEEDEEVLTVTAKYSGTTGNKLEIAIAENTTQFEVVTFLNADEKDRQVVLSASELVDNDWINFEAKGDLVEVAGLPLTGATDGEIVEDNYIKYFSTIRNYKPWNCMAIPSVSEDVSSSNLAVLASTLIEEMRDNGKKVQVVVYNYPAADSEGVISVSQGYKTATETISPELFTIYVAGMTAGAEINESNTYKLIKGAREIINQVDETDIPELLRSGNLLITRRQDGEIVVEQDINTFTSFTPTKGYEFSKNRVIRTIDGYNNDIRKLFENYYIGKVDNNSVGRNIFKADVISYLETLENMNCIENFDSSSDIVISAGSEVDEVVMELWIQPVDAMEKLYNKVYLRANA